MLWHILTPDTLNPWMFSTLYCSFKILLYLLLVLCWFCRPSGSENVWTLQTGAPSCSQNIILEEDTSCSPPWSMRVVFWWLDNSMWKWLVNKASSSYSRGTLGGGTTSLAVYSFPLFWVFLGLFKERGARLRWLGWGNWSPSDVAAPAGMAGKPKDPRIL